MSDFAISCSPCTEHITNLSAPPQPSWGVVSSTPATVNYSGQLRGHNIYPSSPPFIHLTPLIVSLGQELCHSDWLGNKKAECKEEILTTRKIECVINAVMEVNKRYIVSPEKGDKARVDFLKAVVPGPALKDSSDFILPVCYMQCV